MEQNNLSQGRLRRTVDELIVAEMFLVQATIESATAISDGLGTLGRKITASDEIGSPADSIGSTLQQLANAAVEPYSSRYRYLRQMRSKVSQYGMP